MGLLLFGYFLFASVHIVREFFLRQGTEAKTIKFTKYDCNSTFLNFIYFLIVFISPSANLLNFGRIQTRFVPETGIAIMLLGIIVHFAAVNALGKYYTRTLRIIKNQALNQRYLYHWIRHPGYLGMFLISFGFSLVSDNLITVFIVVSAFSIIYNHRINSEEKMLSRHFKKKYKSYMKTTWRLIPFIY